MERRFVFCGCQYPSSSGTSSGRKSGWEWDIPTPKKKQRQISQSNPILTNKQKALDMDSINKRYSDNLYEPVNPRPYYGSDNMQQDPETTSLDDRLIAIPPELDIVTSEGLDGLDQLDAHDYGFDGEKEWNHYPEEMHDVHVPRTFTAGIRKELPKYGETSSERPLMTKTGSTGEGGDHEVPTMPSDEQGTTKSSALTQLKQKADQVKKQLSKISLPAAPKFNSWSGLRLSKKKRKTEDITGPEDEEEVFEQVQVPESTAGNADQIIPPAGEAKSKPPIPPPPKQAGIISKFFESGSTEAKYSKTYETEKANETAGSTRPKTPTKEQNVKKAEQVQKEADRIVVDEEAAARLLREAKEKVHRDKSPVDLKRQQKQEEKLAKEKAQEEAKRMKADEKAAKEKAKEEKKKAEAEDKLLRKKQEEELKRAKQEEERKKAELDADAQRIQMEAKHAAESEKIKLEQEKQKSNIESAGPKDAQPSTSTTALCQNLKEQEAKQQKTIREIEEALEAGATKNVEEGTAVPKEKKSKRSDVFKRKLADIDFTKKFKRSKTPPGRPDEPPKLKYKLTGRQDDDTDNKLAAQYAQEILRRDAEMEIEKEKEAQYPQQQQRLQEPVIFVTQPSVETTTDTESHTTDLRPNPLHYENVPESEAPQKQKFAEKVKGFGQKSKVIASTTSKNLGQKMKVFGHDLKQFGGKVNVKCHETIKDIKATQEAAKKRSRETKQAQAKAKATEAAEKGTREEPEKSPRTSFRFKRRPLNDEENFTKQEVEPVVVKTRRKKPLSQEFHEYLEQHPDEDGRGQKQESKVNRHEVLGRADRDWESPMDLIRSRDPSEEPFSGRYSPPGSSTASSRRQGVLEEIDSDEFFLRERGISEGEDEEEVNRLLMHELRQTFRPLDNSLRGFDMPSPPPRPVRSPRKPPRKAAGKDSNFQTFPPERPKRKQTPGYISAYLNQEQQQQDLEGDQLRMSEEDEFMALESDEDEGIRRVKLELRRIDQDMEDEKVRYEPVLTESPLRPRRSKKDRTKGKENEPATSAERPQIFYYNTIGANEWRKKVEAQIEGTTQDATKQPAPDNPPVAPKRVRRKSEGGKSAKSEGGKSGKSETQFSEVDNTAVGRTASTGQHDQDEMASLSVQIDQSEDSSTLPATLELDVDDSMEYVDYEEDPGGGYAMVVQKKFGVDKGLPKTVPRRKQKHDKFGRKSHSLKRRSQDGSANEAGVSNPVFCSLPRFTPRTFHIVPPTRPHRNYSSLKPKRPPRQHKSDQSLQSLQGPSRPAAAIVPRSPRLGARDEADRSGGAPIVDSIQGRPLPPPPRPQRSPGPPLNDLDHSTIERMVGIRHYANFVGDEGEARVPVVEELCVAKNIPLLGREDEDPNAGESNVGIQTDPVQGEEEIDLNAVGSFEDEDDGIDKQRDSFYRTLSSDGQEVRQRTPARPAARVTDRPPSPRVPVAAAPHTTEVVFPNRLHLDELEVDFLRVNELTAQSITMDHLHAPQLYVDSMSSSGALIVPLIQSSSLAVDQVNTERVSTTDISSSGTSIPPPSFYQLAASPLRPSEGEPTLEADTGVHLRTQKPQRPDHLGRTASRPTTDAGDSAQPATATQVARRSSADDVLRQTARLGRAILSCAMRGLDNLTDYLDAATSNDPECHAQQRSQIQILMCMLLVLVIGIYLLSGPSSPSPRWEFFLPPPDL